MALRKAFGVGALVLGLAALLTIPAAGAAVDVPGEGSGGLSEDAANPLADLPECGPEVGVEEECRPRLGPQGWSIEQQGLAYDYLMEIYEVAHVHPGYGDFGFDHEAGAVQLWFAGELPPEVRDVVERAAKDGVGFEQIVTVYGQQEIESLVDKVYEAMTEAGILMDLLGPQPGFTGIQFSFVPYDEGRPGSGAADDPERLAAAHRIIREIVGDVPYRIIETEPLEALAGRQADTVPYSGAARVRGTLSCTSGIPMRVWNGDGRYLLTAAHCAHWGNDAMFKTGANAELGVNRWTGVLLDTNHLDATLIRLPDRTQLRGAIYAGAWNSATTATFQGISAWAKNIQACQSGSVSGSRCSLRREPGDETSRRDVCTPNGGPCRSVWVFTVIRDSIPGASPQIIARGDSGGPSYWNSPDAGRRVLSLNTAGLTTVTCDSSTDPSATFCYSKAWMTPINRVEQALAGTGIVPNTG